MICNVEIATVDLVLTDLFAWDDVLSSDNVIKKIKEIWDTSTSSQVSRAFQFKTFLGDWNLSFERNILSTVDNYFYKKLQPKSLIDL